MQRGLLTILKYHYIKKKEKKKSKLQVFNTATPLNDT